jgi:uncharacterized integral membrane protein (TIGR00698 family)
MPTPVSPTVTAARDPKGWQKAADRLPGLALVAVLAAVAISLGRVGWFASAGISALTVAIVLGILVGNTLYPRIARAGAGGVTFSKQSLLRLGIILYGLRLTFQDIAHVGIAGVAIDSLVLSSTFVLSWWMGTRLFGLERETALLIGAGSAICGAAAVMATEPVVRGIDRGGIRHGRDFPLPRDLSFHCSASPAADVDCVLWDLCRFYDS